MFKHIQWKKAVPLVIIALLATIFAGTDVLSAAVQTQIIDVFKTYVSGIVPYTANIFVGLIFICLANLIYDPLKAGMEKALNLSNADERGRRIVSRAVLLVYWLIAIIVGVSFIAPDFLSKLVVGFGLFGAAIALALQGIANDFIAGALLNFRPKFCVGDEIELIGVAVKGKVTDIGYVLTVLETENGTFTVPNREVWSRPVKVTKPGVGTVTPSGGLSCTTAEDGKSGKGTADGAAAAASATASSPAAGSTTAPAPGTTTGGDADGNKGAGGSAASEPDDKTPPAK
ncbi:mechanosensitive ion channel family protein [Candidatus Obscuribacterales bacterium]|nr:mechanosensitive ion channel family protein [Candidatus Obscuribacterales bacterium]